MPVIVQPDGRPDATIAIVGARPGRDEVVTRRGFTGPSGDLLWRLLRVPRSECYVTNVCKDFSPTHDTPTRAEIHEALPALRDELGRCSANIIVAIGSDALYALTGKTSIDLWRGSVLESNLLPGRKVLGTWHTAAALRTYSLRYVIELDLRRALRESKYPNIVRPKRTFHINPEFEEARELLRGLSDIVAVDIETFVDKISCVGFSDDPSRAICIPFIGGRYGSSELAELWREVDTVLRTRELEGQNFQFDVTRLERLGFKAANIGFDTMLAHHLLWTELGAGVKRKQGDRGIDSLTGKHSLAFITSCYTDEPYYKDESEIAWMDEGLELGERFYKYWTYNCKDAAVTREASIKLRKELDSYGQTKYFHEHVMSLIRPIMAVQETGMRVDEQALTEVKKRIQLEVDYMQARLNNRVGYPCNVKSPIDLKHLLFNELGFKATKTTKKGAPSLDEDAIRTLAYTGKHTDIFKLILDIRERRTLLSNFLNIEVDSDGRYKAAYLIHGTDSGRLSSRAVGQGPQLQNIPKGTRKIFVPAPGNVFVQGDLSRAEAMYVAYAAEERDLIALFEDASRDLYKEVAAGALGKEVSSITRESIERQCFKQTVLGGNYDMGPIRFCAVLRLQGIDIMDLPVPGASGKAKAEFVQNSYFNRYPGVRRWQNKVREAVSKSRVLVSALGRRRIFLGRLDDYLFRAAYSYDPQATVAAITNRGLRLLYEQGWKIVSQVHDSVKVECPREQLDECATAIQNAMTYPILVKGRMMTIPVDIQWSDKSWGDMNGWRPQS